MATGRQAFYGTSTAVIYEAILNRAPTPLTSVNPQLPPKLEEIVKKALEKDREVRYQHPSEMHADLKRLKRDMDSGRTVPVNGQRLEAVSPVPKLGKAIDSLAVLAFANESNDPNGD